MFSMIWPEATTEESFQQRLDAITPEEFKQIFPLVRRFHCEHKITYLNMPSRLLKDRRIWLLKEPEEVSEYIHINKVLGWNANVHLRKIVIDPGFLALVGSDLNTTCLVTKSTNGIPSTGDWHFKSWWIHVKAAFASMWKYEHERGLV